MKRDLNKEMNESSPECVIPFRNHPTLSSAGLIKFHDNSVALPSVSRLSERKHRPFMWEQTSDGVLQRGTASFSYSS